MTPPKDLLEKTFLFAQEARRLVHDLPQSQANLEDGKQLIIASGSLASHYIEATEASDQNDSHQALKTCIKNVKQCDLWLKLFECGKDSSRKDLRDKLLQDSEDIQKKLFSALEAMNLSSG